MSVCEMDEEFVDEQDWLSQVSVLEKKLRDKEKVDSQEDNMKKERE